MDAPLPSPDALVRPWRTATLVASLVAAIELVLLIWGLSFAITRIVGLSSMLGAVAFPFVYVAACLLRGRGLVGRWIL